ncbi:MAG: ribonuclease HII [Cyanobacteria bacterium]|nr:ribonuclease HII [Cyanobacteriota bacterium]
MVQERDHPVAHLIGVDEVGRGSLIGPIVAAAVSMTRPLSTQELALLSPLNDSKLMKPAEREALSACLTEGDFCHYAIAEASLEEVEALNVYHASLLASSRAVAAVLKKRDNALMDKTLILIDGKAMMPQYPKDRQLAVIKGDSHSACIAAASVLAKVYRDRLVSQWGEQYPEYQVYQWQNNKGYGTAAHLQAIQQFGVTLLHRKQFKGVKATQTQLVF